MRQPGVAFHFRVELAGTPTGVTSENFHLLRLRKRFAEFQQAVERVAEAEIGHHVGVRQEGVGVQIAQGLRLDGAAEKKRLLLEHGGQVGHERFADLVFRGAVEHQAKGAFGIVLADEQDGAVKEGALQLAVVEEQLAL